MGTISNTDPDTEDTAAAKSHVDGTADGFRPETTTDDTDNVVNHNAPGVRLRTLWTKPSAKIGAAIIGGVAIALCVLALTNLSFEPNKPLGAPTVGNPSLQSDAATDPTTPAGRFDQGTTAGLTTLTDTKNGYELTYPNTWSEVADPAPDRAGGGHLIQIAGRNAFSIRTFPIEKPVATANLDDMRAATDSILSTPGAKLQVLDVRKVEVAGLPAVYYLYYFPDGKQRGIHAHYFVFDGTRMHTLVFQVVPADDFPNHAEPFDQVVASFKPLTR